MAYAFINGNIRTMKSEHDRISAFVVHDGRFLYCGTDGEAERIVRDGRKAGIFPAGEVIDLEGRCVLPGFTDDHVHLETYAVNRLKVDLTDCTDIEEIKRRIRDRAAQVPEGQLISGTGFDHTKFREQRLPNAADLDEAAPDHPVIITRYCLHVNVANSLALRLGGVTTLSPEERSPGFAHDGAGNLTGVMQEKEAAELVSRITNGAGLRYEDRKEAVRNAIAEANAFGITSLHPIQGAFCDLFEHTRIYQDLRDENRLNARIYVGYDEFPGCEIRTGLGDDMVRYGFYKIFTDGSMGGRTAYLTEPFSDDPGNAGTCHLTQEELDARVKKAYDLRLQTAVHAIGDRAVEMTLRALKKAHDADPRPWDSVRFRLTHCSLINEDIIGLLKQMQVIVDMQPGYVSTNIRWSDDRVGARAKYLFAWKTLSDLGLTLCGSSDLPCEALNPLVGVYAVETRSGYDGYLPEGWQPQERLDRYRALCLYTKNPAYASFEEAGKGTIETGKLADFTVFDEDVMTVPAKDLLQIKVYQTWLGGRKVFG
ncbi:MAG: amidohydrolase [Lachnospiraceae bacterium]|nr:amidohydrolase [Lachnospiraceae bacterium]